MDYWDLDLENVPIDHQYSPSLTPNYLLAVLQQLGNDGLICNRKWNSVFTSTI